MADYEHIFLADRSTSAPYTYAGGGGGNTISPTRPAADRHSSSLAASFKGAVRRVRQLQASDPNVSGVVPLIVRVDQDMEQKFKDGSFVKSIEAAYQSTAKRRGIQVLNSRHRKLSGTTEHVVAIPVDAVDRITEWIRQYGVELDHHGKPKNEKLLAATKDFAPATLDDFWTDTDKAFPDENEAIWFEVWLDTTQGRDVEQVQTEFIERATTAEMTLGTEHATFPDRTVVVAHGTFAQLRTVEGLFDTLAELRRARVVAGELANLSPRDQGDFVDEMADRVVPADKNAPAVCVLDTGVRRGHALLTGSLSEADTHAWPGNQTADFDGHGTGMCGLALYGCLTEPIYENADIPVELSTRLESVRILSEGANDPPAYGAITRGAMARAMQAAPERKRVYCLAITTDGDNWWRQTTWSASLDQEAFGSLDEVQRLIACSAGNIPDAGHDYPDRNDVSSVQDPSQAWNVLTVGAYTEKAIISNDPSYRSFNPIAQPGELSPVSATSVMWTEGQWPFKPDVVFEGGNMARDAHGNPDCCEDLELLTTMGKPGSTRLLTTMNATSAAAAQAARMGAIILAEYPDHDLWPETVRALIVHSAEWTDAMIGNRDRNKLADFNQAVSDLLLRRYGMGVPDIDRARRSFSDHATLIVQDTIQPFEHVLKDNGRRDGSRKRSCEMKVHDLPLPIAILQDMGSVRVRMRVTLSYFIEPNPARRGVISESSYASHGLRFDVKRPNETLDQMLKRRSRRYWDLGDPDESGKREPIRPNNVDESRTWLFGSDLRTRGSVHCDEWIGTAAELAASGSICVYPTNGWWLTKPSIDVDGRRAKYSLVISISTDESSVDLVQEIQNVIASEVATAVEVDAS